MNRNRKKLLVIVAAIIVGIVLLSLVITLLFKKSNSTITPQSSDSVSTDPITGEKIINTKGISPETTNAGPDVIGASNIEPLFGDEFVFEAVKQDILIAHFKDAKLVKISPSNIIRHVITKKETSPGYTSIDFDVYLDSNTTDKYRVSVKSQDDGMIYATITDPNNQTSQIITSIYGGD